MVKKRVIETATSGEYFHFTAGMILSVRQYPQFDDIDICVFDLGLTDPQKEWLKDYITATEKPEWEFGVTDGDGFSIPFKGVFAKIAMKKYFPGYDVYMHFDADAWLQNPEGVDVYMDGAEKGLIAITPEIDRSYSNNYFNADPFHEFTAMVMRECGGDEYALKYMNWPIFNAGLFAMSADSPIWELWEAQVKKSLQLARHHTVEQVSLNMAILDHFKEFENDLQILPAEFNWLCHQRLPSYDPHADAFVEPYLPHRQIKIIHRTTDELKTRPHIEIRTTEGQYVEKNLQFQEGNLGEGVLAQEAVVGGWQDKTWIK